MMTIDTYIQQKNDEFLREIIKHHISGQLKVAPEHCSAMVLDKMGKPHIHAYKEFSKRYFNYTILVLFNAICSFCRSRCNKWAI